MKSKSLIHAALVAGVFASSSHGFNTRDTRETSLGKVQRRFVEAGVRAADVSKETRQVPVSFSSESDGVLRYDWESGTLIPEILLHNSSSCDFTPLMNAGSFLRNHDPNQIVGAPESVYIDPDGAKGGAVCRFGTSDFANQCFIDVSDGILRGVSFGYENRAIIILKANESYTDPETKRTFTGPACLVTKWAVREITFTPIPADDSVGVGRSQRKEQEMKPTPQQIAQMVRQAGLRSKFALGLIERDLGTMKEVLDAIEAEKKRRAQAPAPSVASIVTPVREAGDDDEDDEEDDEEGEGKPEGKKSNAPTEARQAIVLAERKRASDISSACRDAGIPDAEFAEDLITRGVSIGNARKAIIDKLAERAGTSLAAGGSQHVQAGADAMDKRMAHWEVNLGRRANIPEYSGDQFKQIERQHFSMLDMVRDYLGAVGTPNIRQMTASEMGMALFSQRTMIRAANTGADLPNLLSNIQNKAMIRGYVMAAPTWREWCKKGTLVDFKPAKRIQLSDAAALKDTPEDGEIQDSKINDRGENIQLATYARRYSYTWQMIVNDDLHELTNTPMRFGQSAAKLPSRLVYAALLANPTMADGTAFFATGHSNYNTGTDTALDVTNKVAALVKSQLAFSKQTGPQAPNDTEFAAEPIDVQGPIILVPPELTFHAETLVTPNLYVNDTGPFKGKYRVVTESRLSNAAYSGYSLTAWYQMARAEEADTMEVAFLDGNENPLTQVWENPNVLAFQTRVVLPCGVKPLDWRTAQKNKGAA